MALYVYDSKTGALVSWCPGDDGQVASADELTAKGYAVKTGLPALDATHAWDAATQAVIEVAAPVVPRMVSTGKWVLRFTPDEFDAISASADKIVKHFMYALNRTIEVDLNDATVQQGVGYLAQLGLLAGNRVAAILA